MSYYIGSIEVLSDGSLRFYRAASDSGIHSLTPAQLEMVFLAMVGAKAALESKDGSEAIGKMAARILAKIGAEKARVRKSEAA